MRLLNTGNFEIKEFTDYDFHDNDLKYAILSHTWDEGEVTFQDMNGTDAKNKNGYAKLEQCCSVAKDNGFQYVWIDTCCIDKTSSAELSEAINSMYRWYQEAEVCYAYLADTRTKDEIPKSRWFNRGFTLQELIAPSNLIFFNEKWEKLGEKAELRQDVSDCTGIPVSILSGEDDLEAFSLAQRMSWAAKRETSRVEDRAYCLMGIFGVNMPLIYGERETAFIRLQEEIMRISDDHSLFAWRSPDNRGGLLATSPAAFINSYNIVQFNPFDTSDNPLTVSARGIHLDLRLIGIGRRALGIAILHCKERDGGNKPISIYTRDLFFTMQQFRRVQSQELEQLDLGRFRPPQYPLRRICVQAGRTTRTEKQIFEKLDSISPDDIYPDNKLRLAQLIDSEKSTAISHAAAEGREDMVWLLLTRSDIEPDMKNDSSRTALSWAAGNKHQRIVRMLLDSHADPEAKDEFGQTPLFFAVQNSHEAIVKLLLDRGAEPEAKDEFGQTPLFFAVKNGHEAIVKLLLDSGANTEAKVTRSDQTPLFFAVQNSHEAIVKLLLDKGANTEPKVTRSGQTPLFFAVKNGHEAIVKMLLDSHANTEAKDTRSGQTPLFFAVQNRHEAIVKMLLDKGAKIEIKDTRLGQTSLLIVVQNDHEAFVKLLLDKGAAIVRKGMFGHASLAVTQYGNGCIGKLLDRGAAVKVKNSSG